MTNKEIIDATWHWVVEDKLGFGFAIESLIMNEYIKGEEIKEVADKIEDIYKEYFLDRFGIELFDKCLNCDDGIMYLKESVYGQFMSCNNYPKCKTVFSDRYRRKK